MRDPNSLRDVWEGVRKAIIFVTIEVERHQIVALTPIVAGSPSCAIHTGPVPQRRLGFAGKPFFPQLCERSDARELRVVLANAVRVHGAQGALRTVRDVGVVLNGLDAREDEPESLHNAEDAPHLLAERHNEKRL